MNDNSVPGSLPENEDIVVGKPSTVTGRSGLLKMGGIAVLVCLIAGGAIFWIHHNNEVKAAALAAATDNRNYITVQSNAGNLASEQKFAQVVTAWTEYINETPTPSKAHQAEGWLSIGAAYMNTGQYTQSLAADQKAIAITGLNYDEAVGASQAAGLLKNKTETIYYLKQAIRLIPKDDPYPADDRQLYQQEINYDSQSKS
jgi:tetratricopeptide (TPR) repeat protein